MLPWLLSLSAWDWIDISGVALVFAGVAIGYVTRRRKPPPEPKPEDLEPVKLQKRKSMARRKLWEDAWECMLIVGLGVEIIALGHQISEAAELKMRTSDASERAALAVSNNLVLARTVEELRSNNIALEQQMPPRLIELSRPAARLKEFAGTKAVIIFSSGGDCSRTANQIRIILSAANWDVESIGTPKPVPDGVSVGLCAATNGLNWKDISIRWSGFGVGKSQRHIACVVLLDELNKASIAADVDENMYFKTSLRFDGIVIFVGPSPDQLGEQIAEFKNEVRNLDQKREDVRRSEQPLLHGLTNQDMAAKIMPELNRLTALDSQLVLTCADTRYIV